MNHDDKVFIRSIVLLAGRLFLAGMLSRWNQPKAFNDFALNATGAIEKFQQDTKPYEPTQ